MDERSAKAQIKDIQKFIDSLEGDRKLWISYFEKNIEKVYKGAAFFIGKALWD